jgi:hypothetical protein
MGYRTSLQKLLFLDAAEVSKRFRILMDRGAAEPRKLPTHWTDRFASVAGWDRIASRRIFVLLKPSGPYSPSWVTAAEALLEDHFY